MSTNCTNGDVTGSNSGDNKLEAAVNEVKHLSRLRKLHTQIIKEQKQAIERYSSRLRSKEKALKRCTNELEQLQQSYESLRSSTNTATPTPTPPPSHTFNNDDDAAIEAEIERRLVDRIAMERQKWDISMSIERLTVVQQNSTADDTPAPAAAATGAGDDDEKMNENGGDDDNIRELTEEELTELTPAEQALYRYQLSKLQTHSSENHNNDDDGDGDDNDREQQSENADPITSRENADALSDLVFVNTQTAAEVASTVNNSGDGIKLMRILRQVQGIRRQYLQLRQECVMMKAGVSEMDITNADVLDAVGRHVEQDAALRVKLAEMMKFLHRI